jgi:hypothetical protein
MLFWLFVALGVCIVVGVIIAILDNAGFGGS